MGWYVLYGLSKNQFNSIKLGSRRRVLRSALKCLGSTIFLHTFCTVKGFTI